MEYKDNYNDPVKINTTLGEVARMSAAVKRLSNAICERVELSQAGIAFSDEESKNDRRARLWVEREYETVAASIDMISCASDVITYALYNLVYGEDWE